MNNKTKTALRLIIIVVTVLLILMVLYFAGVAFVVNNNPNAPMPGKFIDTLNG